MTNIVDFIHDVVGAFKNLLADRGDMRQVFPAADKELYAKFFFK